MMNRQVMIVVGVIFFLLLQYSLWFSQNRLLSAHHLTQDMTQLKNINKAESDSNDGLKNDIQALKHDPNIIAEKARQNFGMIKSVETYYDIVGGASDDTHV